MWSGFVGEILFLNHFAAHIYKVANEYPKPARARPDIPYKKIHKVLNWCVCNIQEIGSCYFLFTNIFTFALNIQKIPENACSIMESVFNVIHAIF